MRHCRRDQSVVEEDTVIDRLTIVSNVPLTEEQAARLRGFDPRIELHVVQGDAIPEELLREVTIIFGQWRGWDLNTASKLRWFQRAGAGFERMVGTPLWQSDVVLTSGSGIHAVQIPEYVLCTMLMFAHKFPAMLRAQAARTWRRGSDPEIVTTELHGRTVGIVGLGAIGREVARLARAFGMRVMATRRSAGQPGAEADPNVDALLPPSRLDELLAESDFVVLAAPLTPETRHVIDEAALRRMKPTAYLINVGRGGLNDEAAVIRALRERRIAGAAIDAFQQEPLPPESPFWDLDNAIITPHASGDSIHYYDRAVAIFEDNLRRWLDGQPLRNLVDRARGY